MATFNSLYNFCCNFNERKIRVNIYICFTIYKYFPTFYEGNFDTF